MSAIADDYVKTLSSGKILYMPSCLVVEMMAKLYASVSSISICDDICRIAPDLMALLGRMTGCLAATSDAIREGRIRKLVGDWRADKARARRLFLGIMSRLGYLRELIGEHGRRVLRDSLEEMTAAWNELDRIIQDCARNGETLDACENCGTFRCEQACCWRNALTEIAADPDGTNPDTAVLLICYGQVRTKVLRLAPVKPERVVCIANDGRPLSCRSCYLTAEPARREPAVKMRETVSAGRRPMPPTLAAMMR